MRRARRMEVSGDLLNQIFTARANDRDERFRGISTDAPEDMRITGVVGYDCERDVWTFVCESAVFEPLAEGETPPLFAPAYTTHFDEAKI